MHYLNGAETLAVVERLPDHYWGLTEVGRQLSSLSEKEFADAFGEVMEQTPIIKKIRSSGIVGRSQITKWLKKETGGAETTMFRRASCLLKWLDV